MIYIVNLDIWEVYITPTPADCVAEGTVEVIA